MEATEQAWMPKVGDLVKCHLKTPKGNLGMILWIKPVVRVTAKTFWVDGGAVYRVGGHPAPGSHDFSPVRPATQADVSALEARLSADREAKAKLDAYNAREDVRLARELGNMDTRWEKLSLDKLRRIKAIIDES